MREDIYIGFEELTHFCPFLGPWAKIAKSGLVLLSRLTQGTCVPNFKRFGLVLLSGLTQGTSVPNLNTFRRKLREEIAF